MSRSIEMVSDPLTPPPPSELPEPLQCGTNRQQYEYRAAHNRAYEPSVVWRDEMPKEPHGQREEKEEEQLENV